jgi:hypothetical protein
VRSASTESQAPARQSKAMHFNPSKPADPAVEAVLDGLPTMSIADLRKRYREVFRAEPPKAFGPDLLRRSIAYRIQEIAYGGLPTAAKRMLDRLVKNYWKNPTGRLEIPRRIKPGSALVREWKGKVHQVKVAAGGFSYGGRTYGSLSEIASTITGTKWNGPRFFGLRVPDRPDPNAARARKRSQSARLEH